MAVNTLRDKLIKNSTIDYTDTLTDSKIFTKKDMIPTIVPMMNVALSGSMDGGLTPGLTMFAGPSKHFKTGFALLLASAFIKKYPDGIILFYDSEFGTPQSYFKTFEIPFESVVHTPIMNIEELKFDIVQQLDNITRTDRVMIIIDSIGNLASKKELEDARDAKSVADMSRAKQLKSLFRMITPYLTLRDIPLVVINHTYKEIGLFPKDIVGGGCVVAGTKIKMFDDSLEEIQNITVGSLVKTLNGPKVVTATWNPENLQNGNPDCYKITFDDGSTVICSDEHKFIVNDEWKEAHRLSLNDVVAID